MKNLEVLTFRIPKDLFKPVAGVLSKIFDTVKDLKLHPPFLQMLPEYFIQHCFVQPFKSPLVIIRTDRFNAQKTLPSAHTVYVRVVCGSENKQRSFPYTTLTDLFLYARRSVFSARYEIDTYINSGLSKSLKR
jgi:hypothetical protein